MTGSLVYLDSSAIVKLVVREPESASLFGWLNDWPTRISSAVARVEVLRALGRSGAGDSARRRAIDVLDRMALIAVDRSVLDAAGDLRPRDVRSLDAIHLATALALRTDLAWLVTYDQRLAAAAASSHLDVSAPA
jgi:predicted nucleic acid-binding protein